MSATPRDDRPDHKPGNDGNKDLLPVARQYAQYATVGIMFPVAIALGFFGGYFIDRRLGTVPLFALVGLGLGAAAAIRNLLQTVARDDND